MDEHSISRIDFEFRESIWKGKIPILFSLSENEVISKSQPPKLFLLLPRMTYLPLVTDRVRDHFTPHAPALEDGMWFENFDERDGRKEALKWHLPIGVLYDLYSHSLSNINNNNNNNSSNNGIDDCNPYPIPWKLIVHFQSYPQSNIISRCDNISSVKSVYFNYLKQSLFLSYNSVSFVTQLQTNDQNELWNSVCQSNYSLYLPIYTTMFSKHTRTKTTKNDNSKNENENQDDRNEEKDNSTTTTNNKNESSNDTTNSSTPQSESNKSQNENSDQSRSRKKIKKSLHDMKRYPLRIIVKGFNKEIDLIPIQRPINVPDNPGVYCLYCLYCFFCCCFDVIWFQSFYNETMRFLV